MAHPYPLSDLRLYRTLVPTEITVSATRFNFNDIDWTMIPSGTSDENGDPIPAGWVNDGVVVFPKPAPLDLIGVLNHVRLYIGIATPRMHIGSSAPLNLTLSIVDDAVVFPPGELTITLL